MLPPTTTGRRRALAADPCFGPAATRAGVAHSHSTSAAGAEGDPAMRRAIQPPPTIRWPTTGPPVHAVNRRQMGRALSDEPTPREPTRLAAAAPRPQAQRADPPCAARSSRRRPSAGRRRAAGPRGEPTATGAGVERRADSAGADPARGRSTQAAGARGASHLAPRDRPTTDHSLAGLRVRLPIRKRTDGSGWAVAQCNHRLCGRRSQHWP